jgi:major vault protein
MNRQRDLVLSTNEFCFLQSKTNGAIKTYTGPITMTISAQESLVVFNAKTKKFEETQDFEKAKQLFISAPEGWYVVLKNPATDNSHPEAAKAVNSPTLEIGRKINIAGPVSFSLFPGQMTRVIRGHRLRSNQYLLARVYDAEAARKGIGTATIVDTEGKEITATPEEYFVGQMIVIKGTEVSFYIPPTGIEVIPIENSNEYVRDAVTLERLEYAILKDEDGEKRYIHGPAVVFPKPTETFVTAPKGGLIFRALELSPISGIYVKVIAAYDEKKNDETIHHPIGEELFITGNDQMIYYPRPEHAMIQYDGKYMHHAIAIPEGEGRYILNRLTGEITTVCGPQMYLPDPRKEVVVKRKLTNKECDLMYPGNSEVLIYNNGLTEQAVERMAKKGLIGSAVTDTLNSVYSTANQESALAIFEANANISRGVSYTKPRTITLDTKYEGVVAVDVWTGYAINVVSKSGDREVVIGPATRLFDYDETVEAITVPHGDKEEVTAFLKTENNKVSDIINAQTADFVDVQIKLSYYVDFLKDYKDSWFAVNNYTKYLCDNMHSLIKREIRTYNIKDFYANSTEIIRNIVLDINATPETEATDKPFGRLFRTNGMLVNDVDIIGIDVEKDIAMILEKHQNELIQKSIELADAAARMEVITALADEKKKEAELNNETALYALELEQKRTEEKMHNEEMIRVKKREAKAAEVQAQNDLQSILTAIQSAEMARIKEKQDAEIAHAKELAEIEKAKQEAYAATVKEIMSSIQPDLVAAISASTRAELLKEGMASMSPYAMANGESVADTVNKLLRGTSLEEIINAKG